MFQSSDLAASQWSNIPSDPFSFSPICQLESIFLSKPATKNQAR